MLAYTLFGTNDLEKAEAFYNALLTSINMPPFFGNERMKSWKTAEGAMFGVCKPADGEAATNGNGTMISFKVENTAAVDKAFDYALELGGTQSGELSELVLEDGTIQFYGKYVRDLDNNRVCFFYSDIM